MRVIGTHIVPFSVHISGSCQNSYENEKLMITLLLCEQYTYIYLENVRPNMGRIAEYTKYDYDGKPLWAIKSIKGALFFENSLLKTILDALNTRPLLPDVKALVYHQMTMLPQEIRLEIIKKVDTQIDIKSELYTIFTHAYTHQYDQLVSVFNMFVSNHPYKNDYNRISQMFQDETRNESLVSYYFDILHVSYTFDKHWVLFKGERHYCSIVAQIFRLYEGECRLNKVRWYTYLKVNLNMFFIVQTLVEKKYDFEASSILLLSGTWVHYLRESGLSQSNKSHHSHTN